VNDFVVILRPKQELKNLKTQKLKNSIMNNPSHSRQVTTPPHTGGGREGVCCFLLSLLFILSSCVDSEYSSVDTPQNNFEVLWKLMDEHYCFFDYKKETIGVDWYEVRARYSKKINPEMSKTQLFEVMCQMVGELRDGHVNIGATFDLARNWSYFEDYPRNFNTELVEDYLGNSNEYSIAGGLKYRILDDNVAYVRCASFDNTIGDGNLSLMLDALRPCHGMILDIRNNGGGLLTDAEDLAERFTNEPTLVGYMYHKTGKGHNDFSSPEPVYIYPDPSIRWQKPVVVLTNRKVFSAANDFVKAMREFPLVTIMGDTTGGGSGMPFTLEMPNGWSVRYSAVVTLDADKNHIEFGIEPDIVCSLDSAQLLLHRDSMIETARKFILDKANAQ